jgi:hypothetical protein
MRQIDKLTDEQEALIPEWIERYVKLGTCTDPIDRTTLRQVIDPLYRQLNRKPPLAIVVLDGPLHAWLGVWILATCSRDQVRDQVGDQVGDQVRDQVRAQVRAQVGDQVGESGRAGRE